jgi:flagellar L-ring protein FlgH
MRILIAGLCAVLLAAGAGADSLFSAKAARKGSLIANKQLELEVGYIITVLVQETIDASTEASTDTKKESEVEAEADAANNPFLIADTAGGLNILSKETLPNWSIEVDNEHRARGETRRANKLITTVSCQVTEVLDNGNVCIEGSKRMTVNREESFLTIKGIIRSRDVTASNTVRSNQIADLALDLKGKGPLWNNQRRGIFTKILDWLSPF